MKIAIDINDVLRDYTRQFATLYRNNVDRHIDMDDLDIYTNELDIIFPFNSKDEYYDFIYNKFSFELFGSCPVIDKVRLPEALNNWLMETISNIDIDEPVEAIVVSPMEFGVSIPSTLFFLSKLGIKVREFYFPTDSLTIWDKCDILITANPSLLQAKPENKTTIKITTDYNKECEADYTYESALKFFNDNEKIEKIVNTYGRQ